MITDWRFIRKKRKFKNLKIAFNPFVKFEEKDTNQIIHVALSNSVTIEVQPKRNYRLIL